MSRSTIRIVLAAVALAAAGVAWRETAEVRERTAAASAAAVDLQRAQRRLGDLRARAALVAQHSQELEGKLARLRASGRAPASGPPSEAQLEMDSSLDPGMQAIRLKLWRMRMDLKYAPFFSRMGWSAAQIARFEDVIEEYTSQYYDILSAGSVLGLARASPEIAGLIKTNDDEMAAAQQAWMGPAAFAQMQDFDHTQQERTVAAQLGQNLLFTGAPLSDAQSEQIVQTLRAARAPAGASGEPGEIDWDRATAQAAAYLSPAQLDEFKSSAANARAFELMGQLGTMIRSWEATLPPRPPSGN